MSDIAYDLEELVEDALAAYMEAQLTGDGIAVYEAWGVNDPEYPCVMIHAGESGPVSADAEYHDYAAMQVQLAVMTEGVTTGSGSAAKTARALNREARSEVLRALCKSTLLSDVATVIVSQDLAVAISQCQIAGRSRRTEGRVLVTDIMLDVIAEPVDEAEE